MHNKVATLCLTFDNMGSAASIGQRKRGGPGPDDIGPVGYPEALELLERLGLRATFFIEGWNALHNPKAVQEIANAGHEVGVHGWVHEVLHTLEEIDVERVLVDAVAAFHNLGVKPRGFRAPGGKRGSHTLSILRKLGLQYDSSVDHTHDDSEENAPHALPTLLEGDFPTIPWKWSAIDYYHYYMHPQGEQTPDTVAKHYIEELFRIEQSGGFCTFIFHPFVSCSTAERAEVLERILRYAIESPNIDIVTAGDVASAMAVNR
jgi:peptidoglycan/xylan/chitin deacetylase (PgdA/CDA1 family)